MEDKFQETATDMGNPRKITHTNAIEPFSVCGRESKGKRKKKKKNIGEIVVSNECGMNMGVDGDSNKRKRKRKWKKEQIVVSPYFICSQFEKLDTGVVGLADESIQHSKQKFEPLSHGNGNKGEAESTRKMNKQRKKKEERVVSPYFIKNVSSHLEMNDESGQHKIEPLSDGNGNKGKTQICGDESTSNRKKQRKKKGENFVSPYFIKGRCSQFEMNMDVESRQQERNNEQKVLPLSEGDANKGAADFRGRVNKGKRKREGKKKEIVASPYFIKNSSSHPEINVGVESRRRGRNNKRQCVALSDGYGNKDPAEICGDKRGKRRRERKKKEEIVASPYFLQNRCCQLEMNTRIGPVDESRQGGRNKQKLETLFDGDGIKGAAENCVKDCRDSKGKRKKEKIVVSPYFMKNRCHPTDESTLQGRNNKKKFEVVSDGDGNEGKAELCGDKNKVKKMRERKKESQLEKNLGVDTTNDESRLGEKEIYSAKDTCVFDESARGLKDIDKKNGKKQRRVEGDGDEVSGGGGAQKMEIASLDDLFSQFRYTGGKSSSAERGGAGLGIVEGQSCAGSATIGVGKRVLSPYFANADAVEANTRSEESTVLQPKSKVQTKARCSPSLTSAQKKDEAYRRRTPNNTWIPPRSPFNLLQEDHAFDPWRVLVICMLLNQTTGRQAGSVLLKLFQLCPNAKAATEVATEEIEKEIRSLGLQKKRALGIQQLSRDYLDESWTHVTQLSGVGKYAADAYAIFCTGKWERVKPIDHKLVEYWNFLRGTFGILVLTVRPVRLASIVLTRGESFIFWEEARESC